MAVPPLPLEIVALIIEELRELCEIDFEDDDSSDRHSNGLAVALVCEAWRQLGQGIAWYRLVLRSAEEVESILEHFASYKHLSSCVQELKLASVDEYVDARVCKDAVIKGLLQSCNKLRAVNLFAANWITMEKTLSHVHGRTLLRQFDLTLDSIEEDTLGAVESTVASLVNLEQLNLAISIIIPTTRTSPTPPPALSNIVLSIHELTLLVPLDASGQALASRMLDLIDPATLEMCSIAVQSDDLPLLDRLVAFPRIVIMSIATTNDAKVGPFLLHYLRRAADIKRHCRLDFQAVHQSPWMSGSELVLAPDGEPLALSDFLAAVPAALEVRISTDVCFFEEELPPLPREVKEWEDEHWVERSTLVRCYVAAEEADEPEKRSFMGYELDGKMYWEVSAAGEGEDDSENEWRESSRESSVLSSRSSEEED